MRLTLLWRGSPLLGLDLQAVSPEDPEPADQSLNPPMGLSGTDGGSAELAEPMTGPDTRVVGIGPRPESRQPQ